MHDILSEIVSATRSSLPTRIADRPPSSLRSLPAYSEARRGFARSIAGGPLAIVAEHKRRSPSRGLIREDRAVEDIVASYEAGGARAVSIVTEPDYFGGSLADLVAARNGTSLPLLRKDFVVDPYQLEEARAYGADAVLLIAAVLSRTELAELFACARELGLDALVEIHEPHEIGRVDLDTMRLIGVNNRNLRTFDVDINRCAEIFTLLPADTVRVAESGFHTADDLRFAAGSGADAVLAGERLMLDPDPRRVIEGWVTHAEGDKR